MLSNIGFEPQKYQGIFICMLKIKFCQNHDSSIKLQFDIYVRKPKREMEVNLSTVVYVSDMSS